jgi:hypothetical protein
VKTCSAGFGQKCATVNVFTIKKEIVTIVADANLEIHVGVSSRDLETLPLPCEYLFSLMNFTVNIKKRGGLIKLSST